MSPSLSPKREIKGVLHEYGVYPSKKLGQNFIIDRSAIKKFLKAANLKSEDVVLEIGPGIGNLTQEIAKEVKKVIAVEKDLKMCEILKETLKNFNNVEVVIGDVLKIPDTKYKIHDTKYKIVANLPFYLTSPVIRKFLEPTEVRPLSMTLIVQKEVAQRMCARPPSMNLLAVSVQFYAKPEIISYISKKSFWPQPKVDGAILKISAFNQRRKSAFNQRFFRIVKAGFSHPRKQLANNLANILKLSKEEVNLWLLKNNIKPSQRAETLTIQGWINLTKTINKE